MFWGPFLCYFEALMMYILNESAYSLPKSLSFSGSLSWSAQHLSNQQPKPNIKQLPQRATSVLCFWSVEKAQHSLGLGLGLCYFMRKEAYILKRRGIGKMQCRLCLLFHNFNRDHFIYHSVQSAPSLLSLPPFYSKLTSIGGLITEW